MSWPKVALGELVQPISKWNPSSDAPDEYLSYIDIASVDQERKQVVGHQRVLGAEAPSRARQLVEQGDVLVSTVRPNLNAVAFVGSEHQGATASTGFSVLRASPKKLDGRFLYHWSKHPRFVEMLTKRATGQSYPAVSDKIIKETEIPLPPLEEQKRIAAILDKADDLRRLRRHAIERLDTLSQSIFGEHQDELDLAPTKLSDVCEKITDGTHQSPKWADDGVPFLFVSNIRNQVIDFNTEKFITDETYDALTRNTKVEPGDVLYTSVGSYGHTAIVPPDVKFLFQRHIAHIKPNAYKVDSTYLMFLLESPQVKAQADRLATGIAQKTVTLGALKSFIVKIPSLSIQQTMSSKLMKVKQQFAVQKRELDHLETLFASLQQRAFRGEL